MVCHLECRLSIVHSRAHASSGCVVRHEGGMIIIPGEPEPKKEALFAPELIAAMANDFLDRSADFAARVRLWELRKSCGVEPELTTLTIRRSARYTP